MKYFFMMYKDNSFNGSPMSYGRNNEPHQTQLLDRGRATLFDTVEQAKEALAKSLRESDESGAKWTNKFSFRIIECE